MITKEGKEETSFKEVANNFAESIADRQHAEASFITAKKAFKKVFVGKDSINLDHVLQNCANKKDARLINNHIISSLKNNSTNQVVQSRIGDVLIDRYTRIDTRLVKPIVTFFPEYPVYSLSGNAVSMTGKKTSTLEDIISVSNRSDLAWYNKVIIGTMNKNQSLTSKSGDFDPQSKSPVAMQSQFEVTNFEVPTQYMLQRTSVSSIFRQMQNEATLTIAFNELDEKRELAAENSMNRMVINTLIKGNKTGVGSMGDIDISTIDDLLTACGASIRDFTTEAQVKNLEKFLNANRAIRGVGLKDYILLPYEAYEALSNIKMTYSSGGGAGIAVNGIVYLELQGYKFNVCSLLSKDNATAINEGFTEDRLYFYAKEIKSQSALEVDLIIPHDTVLVWNQAVTDGLDSNIAYHYSQWSAPYALYDGVISTYNC